LQQCTGLSEQCAKPFDCPRHTYKTVLFGDQRTPTKPSQQTTTREIPATQPAARIYTYSTCKTHSLPSSSPFKAEMTSRRQQEISQPILLHGAHSTYTHSTLQAPHLLPN
jgi:hypothetical protein